MIFIVFRSLIIIITTVFECNSSYLILFLLVLWTLLSSQVDYRAKVWSCNFCFQRNQVNLSHNLVTLLCIHCLYTRDVPDSVLSRAGFDRTCMGLPTLA